MTGTLDKTRFQFASDEVDKPKQKPKPKPEPMRWVRIVPMDGKRVALGIEIACGEKKLKVPCEVQVPNALLRQLQANARKPGYVIQWLPEGMTPDDVKRY